MLKGVKKNLFIVVLCRKLLPFVENMILYIIKKIYNKIFTRYLDIKGGADAPAADYAKKEIGGANF